MPATADWTQTAQGYAALIAILTAVCVVCGFVLRTAKKIVVAPIMERLDKQDTDIKEIRTLAHEAKHEAAAGRTELRDHEEREEASTKQLATLALVPFWRRHKVRL